MTVTEATATTQEPETADNGEAVNEKGYLKLKDVHQIPVYVDPATGWFYAKFSQGTGAKWFSRDSLPALEQLLTAHVFPFSGHIEVATRPANIIASYELDRLRDSLKDPVKGQYSYGTIRRERSTTVLTGVQRRESRRTGTAIYFRTEDGSSEEINRNYVRPRADLDAFFYETVQAYLQNQETWQQKIQDIIDQYPTITSQEIVDELRKQGARAGR